MVDRLDEILKRRAGPPQAPGNLATRIIEASRNAGARRRGYSRSWMEALLDNLLLPQPALAMAIVLLLGAYFGFALEDAYVLDQDLSILYVEDTMELRDWL